MNARKNHARRPPLFASIVVVGVMASSPASAQERRGFLYGTIGGASVGHADSEQGKVPVFGGGMAYQVLPRLVLEADVHGARVDNVFGREQHVFTQITLTGSLLVRAPLAERVDVLAGGGLGVQRAHADFTLDPLGRIEHTDTVRLVHGRAGVQWDLSSTWAMRAEGVIWMGSGVDWVLGGRMALGYRF